MIVLFLSLWPCVCKYFSNWFACPCILLLIKCMSCSVLCKGCLRCSVEEFSRKFTCSNSCLRNFHSSGQLDEGFLQFECERNVCYLAFIFLHLPIISTWSMVLEFIVHFDVVSINIDVIFFGYSNFVFVSICSVIFVLSIATINFLLAKVWV
jgi:hypothetical protein